jgi:hypothetical protein
VNVWRANEGGDCRANRQAKYERRCQTPWRSGVGDPDDRCDQATHSRDPAGEKKKETGGGADQQATGNGEARRERFKH